MSNKDNKKKQTITIVDNSTGNSYEFPIVKGSLGPKAIDIRNFLVKTGIVTLDPGFTSTASCNSSITFIDGNKGQLLHRGYNIKELAEKGSFTEVSYLLLNGELPNAQQLKDFNKTISSHSELPAQMDGLFKSFPKGSHPMSIMVSSTGALASYYHDNFDIQKPKDRELAAQRLIAKMPVIAAHAHRQSTGQALVKPRKDFNFAENFLYMTFSKPSEPYVVNPVLVDAMEKIFILHADHEQNASTSTVRLAGSSMANPFACIASGISSLWGASHGGANEAVLKMLEEIGDVSNIPEYINKAKDKNDAFRLMGFGHRVYKNYDPRAEIMRKTCHEVLKELGVKDPLLDVAMELEKIALQDEYFKGKKLYPNVDFYSGIILKAMGFPTSMFTPIFALSRTAGWTSQWKEMIEDPSQKIGRPRQVYEGYKERPYVLLKDRAQKPSVAKTKRLNFPGNKP